LQMVVRGFEVDLAGCTGTGPAWCDGAAAV